MRGTLAFILLFSSVCFAERQDIGFPADVVTATAAPPVATIVPAAVSPEADAATRDFLAKATDAAKRGLTSFRIAFLATDEELAEIKHAHDTIEGALGPPSLEDHGILGSKIELLKNPWPSLNLRRSYENLIRVARTSGDLPPSVKATMLTAATLFGITHGGESVVAVVEGTRQLLHGNFKAAASLFSMIVPGFTDIGCMGGAVAFSVRASREAMKATRSAVVLAVGKSVKGLGVPLLMKAIFENKTARERIEKALAKKTQISGFDIEIADKDLMNFTIHRGDDKVAELHFKDNGKGELVLDSMDLDPKQIKYAAMGGPGLQKAVKDFGWNVKGAVRLIQQMVTKGQENLIAGESSFVSSVDQATPEGPMTIHFVDNAVALSTKPALRPAKEIARNLGSLTVKLGGKLETATAAIGTTSLCAFARLTHPFK